MRMVSLAALALSAAVPPQAMAPADIVGHAPITAWRTIPAEDLLVGMLQSGERVVFQLAPHFAPRHVANLRALAQARWWDNAAINRVQDNFVVQWGGATITTPPPSGITTSLPPEYAMSPPGPMARIIEVRDAWSDANGFIQGWPVTARAGKVALAHCYGTLGAGRGAPPDTGWGSELYVVIGQAPRQLDRNMAVVGRVIEGMEFLAGLPRGRATGGELAGDQPPIRWRNLVGADRLPADRRPAYEYLDTASPSFIRYAKARATYRSSFYLEAPGRIDLCNVRIPIRPRARQ